MKVASLLSGCGGLDLGFKKAGFEIVYANDNEPSVWKTYEDNLKIGIDKRSLFEVTPNDIPAADGIIGGPPCQSWSLAGKMRGKKDERGKLFYKYISILKEKRPKFFLAENVPGIISKAHIGEFNKILIKLSCLGYNLSFRLVNCADYGVPQERHRLIIVGYHESLGIRFAFPQPSHFEQNPHNTFSKQDNKWRTLRDAIGDLPKAVMALEKNKANKNLLIPNHEFMTGKFSYIYMSRNRRRLWSEPSFTIQASGRHAPLHPSSSKMVKLEPDVWTFKNARKSRRLSVREAARIQTFPDDFVFYYENVADGYRMIGNAVPPTLSEVIAVKIFDDLKQIGKDKLEANAKEFSRLLNKKDQIPTIDFVSPILL
jgi:DNA (cytosine-5)-methyltransferase 1